MSDNQTLKVSQNLIINFSYMSKSIILSINNLQKQIAKQPANNLSAHCGRISGQSAMK